MHQDNPTAVNGTVIALSRDLFFGMRIRTVLKQLGHDVRLVKDETSLVEVVSSDVPSLVLVNFNAPVDWPSLTPVIEAEVNVVGFGAHTDVEGFRAAKAAGVDRVVSNGQLNRSLPDLVARYAKA